VSLDSAGDKQIEVCWIDLEKRAADGSRALLALSARPTETVAFLRRTMKPLTIKSAELKSLLLKLGTANEAGWNR
jgi:hypothetical protein